MAVSAAEDDVLVLLQSGRWALLLGRLRAHVPLKQHNTELPQGAVLSHRRQAQGETRPGTVYEVRAAQIACRRPSVQPGPPICDGPSMRCASPPG
ncbi:hypothetical protein J3F83DRAFT_256153 [Trichoderma novae-zelandiae]